MHARSERLSQAIDAVARYAVAAEREDCAKILDELADSYHIKEVGCWDDGEGAESAVRKGAALIRARGKA